TLVAAVLVTPWSVSASPVDCEPARCALQTALETECPCAAATNHGQHVSCVAHVVKRLSDNGTVPPTCKGKIVRCASRSTCGKTGFVTCQLPVAGTCDTTTGTCVGSAVPCTTDAECTTSRCKIRSSSDSCQIHGGVVGTSSTCCADCAP